MEVEGGGRGGGGEWGGGEEGRGGGRGEGRGRRGGGEEEERREERRGGLGEEMGEELERRREVLPLMQRTSIVLPKEIPLTCTHILHIHTAPPIPTPSSPAKPTVCVGPLSSVVPMVNNVSPGPYRPTGEPKVSEPQPVSHPFRT